MHKQACKYAIKLSKIIRTSCLFQPGYFCLGFAPVVDGLDGFLPDIPLEMRKRGEFPDIPVMTGYLQEDGALYTLGCEY